MLDTYRLIPPENIKGRELAEWHVVECQCWHWSHTRVVPHGLLHREGST